MGVSDHPKGSFGLLSTYHYVEEDAGDEGIFNDAGVLVMLQSKGYECNYEGT